MEHYAAAGLDHELDNFRRQWQEEVRNRGSSQQASSPLSNFSVRRRLAPFALASPSKLAHLDNLPHDTEERHDDTSQTLEGESQVPHLSSGNGTDDQVLNTALEHYEKASQKESEGSLGESLRLYRKALRMDARVEAKYREKHVRKTTTAGSSSTSGPSAPNVSPVLSESTKPNSPVPSSNANTVHRALTGPSNISDLIASFVGLQIEAALLPTLGGTTDQIGIEEEGNEQIQAKQKGHSLLAALPSELLLHVLHFVAQDNIAAFTRLSLICKALAYVVATEESIWRLICETSFNAMIWDWRCDYLGQVLELEVGIQIDDQGNIIEGELPRQLPPPSDDLLPNYGRSYKKMFMDRPRIRYNGVYISTCNYLRQGASSPTMISWNTPVHIVTYYRYLRFYPDGTVLSLLTTHEPAEVVRSYNKTCRDSGLSPWGKYIMRGRWRMDVEGNLDVETEGAGGKQYVYRMAFAIKSAGRSQKQNKLVWKDFWCWNRLTDDTGEFSLRNDKPFFFSRVGAYEREMGLV